MPDADTAGKREVLQIYLAIETEVAQNELELERAGEISGKHHLGSVGRDIDGVDHHVVTDDVQRVTVMTGIERKCVVIEPD